MATGKAFSSVKRLAFSVLAVCIASYGFADKPFFFRHIGYGNRGALADNNFVNVNLYQYRGGREVGDDLTHYIGTGKYLVGHGQNRIDTWFYVPPTDAGTWNIQQGYDDYMALSIDGAWVLINNTYTRSAEATIEMTEGWHACQIVYGDTYGGYGPNNFSPWSNEYPIGISINGGALRRFHQSEFQFGDPTAAGTGDFNPVLPAGTYCFSTMAPVLGRRVVINPETTTYWLFEAPDLTKGGTFALAPALSGRTSGRFRLIEWETGSPILPADLNALFDASSAQGANVKVTVEGLGTTGGELWVDLDWKTPSIAFRHLKFPATVSALTLDGGFQNMSPEAYVTATYGYHDVTCLHNSYIKADVLWAESLLYHSQNRMDGWFYVPADRAGTWEFIQGFDDFMAIAVDNEWIIVNETYQHGLNASIDLTPGWHPYTIVFGDTVGDFGPAGTSPWAYEYPIGVRINGGEMVKFLAANVTFGSPLDGLVGDCVFDMPGTLQFYALDVPSTGRLVFDPAVSELHSVSAPNFAPGAKFAFPSSYAGLSRGRFLLASWDQGTPTVSIDNFDASCVNAPNAVLTVENIADGGRLWINLDPSSSVVTARWTGAKDDNCDDPANWLCMNAEGDVIAGVVPDAGTTVYVSGPVALQIPVGAAFTCAEFVVEGALALSADCDWRGLDPAKISAISFSDGVYREIASLTVPKGVYFGTGIMPNQDTHVVMDLYVVGNPDYWFGAWNVAYNNGAYCVCNDGAGGIYSGYGNQGGTQGAPVGEGRHTIELDRNIVKVDGEVRRTFDPVNFQVNYVLTLFAQNRVGSAYASSTAAPTFYSCQIYDNDVLVRDLRPACRLTDGSLGLIDRVTMKFYVPFGGSPTTVDGISLARTFDLQGHKLVLAGADVAESINLTVTGSATESGSGGELHFDVPAGKLTRNTRIFIAGDVELVKEGAGAFMPLVRNATYAGGTLVAAGTIQMAAGTTDNDNSYSPYNFKDTFGARDTTITVMPGAVFDVQGNYDLNLYKLILEGGTLASWGGRKMTQTTWGGFGSITLSDDAVLDAAGDTLHTAGTLDLGGKTLDYLAGDSLYLKFRDCSIANGTVRFAPGGSTAMFQTAGAVDASTASLDFNCRMEIKNEMTVKDVVFRHEGNWGWSSADVKMKVLGRFNPCGGYFPGIELQNGATLDLSEQELEWSIKSRDEQRSDGAAVEYWVTFASGAKIGVDLGSRSLRNGDCVVAWDAEHAPPAGVRFRSASGSRAMFVAQPNGLYYYTGFAIYLR